MSGPKIPRGAPGRHVPPARPRSPLNPGQVVFYPLCAKTTRPGTSPYVFQGHGFGVHLGVAGLGQPEPTKYMVPILMAGIGWVSFEEVRELLGEEACNTLMDKFRAKYEAKEEESKPEDKPAIVAPEAPKLIGLDGQPLKASTPSHDEAEGAADAVFPECTAINPSDSECAGPRD